MKAFKFQINTHKNKRAKNIFKAKSFPPFFKILKNVSLVLLTIK